MTEHYLTNITPDSFSGLIFGFEGIQNTVVIINGPTGCKFYHSSVSDNQGLRQMEFDPLNYPQLWYFGQPRIPCTYLDKRDYIYGSRAKIEELIDFLKKNLAFDLLVVINSPGAALIGDNLSQIVRSAAGDIPAVIVESPGYSKTVWEGYSRACELLIEQFAEPVKKHNGNRKRVNLLGLSIFQKYYLGDTKELTRLLSLCGIDVNCALCSHCTLDEIRRLADADLNLVIYPEYGLSSASALKKRFSTPYTTCSGLPIGFSATENWIKMICDFLECDSTPALLESERGRADAYIHISRVNSLTGMPKGVKFAVHGTCSQCYGYARFFIRYFGMTADSISVLNKDDTENYKALAELLNSCGMENALDKDIMSTDAALVFADADIIAKLKLMHRRFSGIEIGLPSFGYIDVIPKSHLGLSGSLLLCEQILNGLVY